MMRHQCRNVEDRTKIRAATRKWTIWKRKLQKERAAEAPESVAHVGRAVDLTFKENAPWLDRAKAHHIQQHGALGGQESFQALLHNSGGNGCRGRVKAKARAAKVKAKAKACRAKERAKWTVEWENLFGGQRWDSSNINGARRMAPISMEATYVRSRRTVGRLVRGGSKMPGVKLREQMEKSPNANRFSLLALGTPEDEDDF